MEDILARSRLPASARRTKQMAWTEQELMTDHPPLTLDGQPVPKEANW